ncbi:MAG: ABC transporter permease [Lachnospiraceae bacterium]|jgi:ribose transport system permease protein
MKKRINIHNLVPFIAFAVIFLFFTFASYNPKTGVFMMLTARNLTTILEQSMMTILVASGTLFVVAQGSTDLSVGVNLALSGVLSAYIAFVTGIDFLLIPIALVVGLIVGLINGIIVSRFKVSSFMVTLAMLIGIRGLVNYLQVYTDIQKRPEGLDFMNKAVFKIPCFIIIMAIMLYLFEFTKAGRYSRAIGENETTAKSVGVPVRKFKIIAFALSGIMAGVGAILYIVTIASTSNQMGTFLEIRVIMAIYLGGVLVTGGSSAKFYKILLGSFSIQIIVTGLALMGKSDVHISQSVQGILLILILVMSSLGRNIKSLKERQIRKEIYK